MPLNILLLSIYVFYNILSFLKICFDIFLIDFYQIYVFIYKYIL
ncbi:hypothetical protein BGAPBR_H0018 (plasmid) [Borreliella garinii PBr]|uniref:Uncharacterized protein n=1 Tax=Borreliella garinii PBr TaxID=498743 RepID=B8F1H0_BORGR|nr:hypothetical protein BGAPBR_H0018 [Borreliella garinii PBr]